MSTPPTGAEIASARSRVIEYVRQRTRMSERGGLMHPDEINSVHSDPDADMAPLRLSDLRALLRLDRLGLIGRDDALVAKHARRIHDNDKVYGDYTPLRKTADRRGYTYDLRIDDGRILRVTVELDRVEERTR